MTDHVEVEEEVVTALESAFVGEVPAPIRGVETAIATRTKASLQARYWLAQQNPRSLELVRAKVLAECTNPALAEAAIYKIPRGGTTISGPSIRLAEAIRRSWGNNGVESTLVEEDDQRRVYQVSFTDYESGIFEAREVVVQKTVERSKPEKDGSYISVRKNSNGQNTFTVRASEDDLLMKQNSLISKAERNMVTAAIPRELLEEAVAACKKRLQEQSKKPGESKRVVDAFATLGVPQKDLEGYIGLKVADFTPDTLQELRAIYTAIKDGETTWGDVTAGKLPAKKGGVAGLKEKLAEREPGEDG